MSGGDRDVWVDEVGHFHVRLPSGMNADERDQEMRRVIADTVANPDAYVFVVEPAPDADVAGTQRYDLRVVLAKDSGELVVHFGAGTPETDRAAILEDLRKARGGAEIVLGDDF